MCQSKRSRKLQYNHSATVEIPRPEGRGIFMQLLITENSECKGNEKSSNENY